MNWQFAYYFLREKMNMKNFTTLVLMLSFLCCSAATTYAFRCDSGKLATKGKHKYEILKDCGPPIQREVVGSDENGNFQFSGGSGSYQSSSRKIEHGSISLAIVVTNGCTL